VQDDNGSWSDEATAQLTVEEALVVDDANKPPTAHIDSISPSPATAGQLVKFGGHGTDGDGIVVAYSWTSSIDGEISTDASFTSSALSAGTHTISYRVQDDDGAWSEAMTSQLTVEGQADEAFSMEDAIDVVVEEILPGIPEVAADDPYWCLRLDSILPEGTVIEEDSGNTLRITLHEDMFFFYLDLAPSTFYAHPVKYILVNEDGKYRAYDANWWPRIDNVIPDEIERTIPIEKHVIATNVSLTQPIGIAKEFVLPPVYTQIAEGFIVVQGLMTDEPLYDASVDTYLNGLNFFTAYKNASSRVEGLVQEQAANVLDEIDEMAAEGRRVITIYIIAHGNVDSVNLGGDGFSADQFHDKMAEYPDIIFNFILGSCHSGSFIDDLNTLDNVCSVHTACAADEGATRDYDSWGSSNDINPSDVGSEWTSSLIEAMVQLVENPDKFKSVRTSAIIEDVPVTCMLICQAGWGALGVLPGLGLNDDLDFSHVMGWSTPSYYCSFETLE
jgi:hypothetical protein